MIRHIIVIHVNDELPTKKTTPVFNKICRKCLMVGRTVHERITKLSMKNPDSMD